MQFLHLEGKTKTETREGTYMRKLKSRHQALSPRCALRRQAADGNYAEYE